MTEPLLDVRGLEVLIRTSAGDRRIISDVTLTLDRGRAIGLVGESGSGKSVSVRAMLRILTVPSSVGGGVSFDGRDVYGMNARELRQWHAQDVSIVYQDPRAHINPVRTIGDFLTEGLRFRGESRSGAWSAAVDMLRRVGMDDADRRMTQYPHQLSGGLLQRVMIASTLLSKPKLLVADEPTTALDVTTQEEVMAILDELRREESLAMIFITHDLDLAAAVTDELAVMYAGMVVESGPSESITAQARHPYTIGLLASRPSLEKVERLVAIPGQSISAHEAGVGCVFASRCAFAAEACFQTRPTLRPVGGHQVACHRAEEIAAELVPEAVAG